LRVEVQFERHDPPEGRLEVKATSADAGDGEPVVFQGWLGLLAVLQVMADADAAASALAE
jgi:hypothetical protein